MLIFDLSVAGRFATAQAPQITDENKECNIPKKFLRENLPNLPEVSELDCVRHYTNLSTKNFAIDKNFYPLGSCTMKYNPRAHRFAFLPGFVEQHPLTPVNFSQGILATIYSVQEIIKVVTGMPGVSLTPMAGAQGELAGVMMIRAYHAARNDFARDEMIVPDAAHGTNPASARMCGYKVKEIKTDSDGNVDLESLKAALSERTAGIMLTNPSTLGVFEQKITEIAKLVHQAGGLLYYDGANLNAIVGKTTPGKMGFDVVHLNLHKTFSTPHGGGGPGAGPVAVSERLKPFLPVPYVIKENNQYSFADKSHCPQSIGRLSAFYGNYGVLLRAYIYMRIVGKNGMPRIAEFAALNANYLAKKLSAVGFELAFPKRRASHEFIITLKELTKKTGVTATDFVKRLLDYGIHAPTVYFPLLVPECLLIEPTETESKQTLDHFVEVMHKIKMEAETNSPLLKTAPHTMPVKRLDEVRAAKELCLVEAEQ